MCGISGVVSQKNVSKILLDSIRNLEYRGYDSCGIAMLNGETITVRKDVGAVDEVNKKEKFLEVKGLVGIAHTRWATHGGVTKINSHPHLSCDGKFAVIHNGIISNFDILRDELISKAHTIVSETDTEIIAHLLEENYNNLGDVEKSLINVIERLEGTYGFVFITLNAPGKIYSARKESPLILGVGTDSMFVGSDINAFIDHTRNVVYLNDGEYAIIDQNNYVIKDAFAKQEVERDITRIEWDAEISTKGGYPHFMLKEIHEGAHATASALKIENKEIKELTGRISRSSQTFLTGIGTTYYVALAGQYYFSSIAKKFIPAVCSDEFKELVQVGPDSLILVVSQSGETYDTLRALRYAKEHGASSAAIVNAIGTSIYREVDQAILQRAGKEVCVLSTKSTISQIVILLRVAIELAYSGKVIDKEKRANLNKNLKELPNKLYTIYNELSGKIHTVARKHSRIKNWLFLGRGIYNAVALESALKFKEGSYLHAEGMPAGFLKHGTISLIDKDMYCAVFLPPESEKELYDLTLSSVQEIRARNGFVLGVHFDQGRKKKFFDDEIILPEGNPLIAPIMELAAGQLLAYFTAITLKRNVDKPRALAKSVTVA